MTTTTYEGFYANELYTNHRGQEEVGTAMNGNYHHGYTVMLYSNLSGKVEGSNLVLDVVLKELLKHKEALEDGKRVNVYVNWTLSEDRTEYTSCNFIKTEIVERED